MRNALIIIFVVFSTSGCLASRSLFWELDNDETETDTGGDTGDTDST